MALSCLKDAAGASYPADRAQMGEPAMTYEVAKNGAVAPTDEERNNALRLLGLIDSPPDPLPLLPNLPEMGETATGGFAVRIGSST